MSFSFMYDACFLDHRSEGSHPECRERLMSIWNRLSADKLVSSGERIPARLATVRELGLAHEESFVTDTLAALDRETGYLDPDTYFSQGSKEAALKAVGGTIDAARAVYHRRTDGAFALVRPPGHHATSRRAMGFCIFNNIAAAAHALLEDGAQRILIFDWDVHHGNGTEEIFKDDPRALFISVHQWPQYPGTGRVSDIGVGAGAGYTVNIPFPSGSTDADYAAAVEEVLLPAAARFRPEIVLVSAGFDAHGSDPLGGMRLTSNGFAHMAASIRELAKTTGRGPCYVLEGGYHLDALAESAAFTVQASMGAMFPKIAAAPSVSCRRVLDEVRNAHNSFL